MKITGTVKAIKYRKDDFAIITLNKIECENKVTQKRLDRTCDCKLHITCLFENDVLEMEATVGRGKYGEPIIEAQAVKVVSEADEAAVLQFLRSRGGMKPAAAKKAVEALGLSAVKKIATDATTLDFLKLKAGEAEKISTNLRKYVGYDEVGVYLKIANIPIAKAQAILEEYGSLALTTVKKMPYKLTYKNILAFSECDRLAKALNYEENNTYRLQAILYAYLNYNFETSGNVFERIEDLNTKANEFLEIYGAYEGEVDLSEVLAEEVKKGYVINDDGRIYKKFIYELENDTAEKVMKRLGAVRIDLEKVKARDDFENKLDDDQKGAVLNSLSSQLSLIAGFAGSGKTTTAKTLIAAAEAQGKSVKLLAPTGKAAERMSEATNKRAETIHRALKLQVDSYETEEVLTEDLIVVDEATMIDLQLFNCLLSHVWADSQIVLLGDPAQLPSVGGGNVFADLLRCPNVPSRVLTQVHRQAGDSGILKLATEIRNSEELSLDDTADLKIYKTSQVISKAKTLYNMLEKKGEVCLLSCTRKAVELMNDMIQTQNENTAVDLDDLRLKEADKVIVVKNDYEKDVFNGDVGVVESITDKIVVRFSEEKVVEFGFEDADELQLAYSLTVHKSQGSEYEYVVLVLDKRQALMINKNILYTAITRAKKGLYIVMQEEDMIREKAKISAEADRKSNLCGKIC